MLTMVPGVFVDELPRATRSVEAVGTSIPVFLGYTERAKHNGTSLRNTRWRLTSMFDFDRCFGGAPTQLHVRFSLTETASTDQGALALAGSHCSLAQTHGFYVFYSVVQ